jgi:ribosomal protein L37AE/L43A
LSEIRTFFRFCPSCGKRFEIRLVDKKLVGDREVQDKTVTKSFKSSGGISGFYGPRYATLEEGTPVTVYVEEFQYTYKCKHCGHQWTEVKEEKSRLERD